MFNFHKPRVYRSADGCCICRAKSSSSRFTASRKYEKESMLCFNLHEPRNGEICNACVLLVKRYKRLPAGSKRHWGHVVDARAGPGTKSLAKQKKREHDNETKGNGNASLYQKSLPKSLKRIARAKILAATAPAPLITADTPTSTSPHSEEQPSDSNESYDDEQQQQQQQQGLGGSTAAIPYQTRKRTAAAALATTATTTTTAAGVATAGGKRIASQQRSRLTGSKRRRMLEPRKHRRAVDNVPFFEEHDLLRLDVCCGIVYQSLSLGSSCYIIDTESYKPCEKHRYRRQQAQEQQQQQQHQPISQAAQSAVELDMKPVSQIGSTPALKKHHLYFKRQSESFPQGDIHRISPIPLNKTEAMPVTTPTPAQAQQQQQQQHSNLSLTLKPTVNSSTAAVVGTAPVAPSTSAIGAAVNSITRTAVGAASPSSLSSSSNCSTSSSVATKFNDNSSDSGFDEHVLERKSVSPPTQDELHMDKKLRAGNMQRLILASGLPISGQPQNLVLTGNEFTARFVQRQQQAQTQAQPLKINVLTTAAATPAAAAAATVIGAASPTGSQSSGNKMRAIFNNANTIQHENGVTTILPASSIAASNQTAAMNAIAPSTVTITPAKKAATGHINVTNPKFILLKPTIATKCGGSNNKNNNQINNNNNSSAAAAELKII